MTVKCFYKEISTKMLMVRLVPARSPDLRPVEAHLASSLKQFPHEFIFSQKMLKFVSIKSHNIFSFFNTVNL